MLASIRLKLSAFLNRFHRRQGFTLRDRCMKVIMHTCSLQLERTETRELAPTPGATGPMLLSGGAITTVTYKVFDSEADKVDPKIREEAWRAFAVVTMRLTVEQDPSFEVTVEGTAVVPRACHKAPGLKLIQHLSNYFPLIARPHQGPVIKPITESA